MDPNIPLSQSDWEETPPPVKAYILELRATVHRLQRELHKYLDFQIDPDDALCFNGLTDYLVTPAPLCVNTEEFSFEARIYVNGNRAGEFKIIHIYGPGQEPHGANWVLGPPVNVGWLSYQWGGVWWGVIDSRGIFHAIHSGPARSGDVNPPLAYMNGEDSVPVDSWHHIMGTWDGQVMSLYVDGQNVKEAPFSGDITLSTAAYMGAHYGGTSQFLPGRLDDVRIWNRALTQDEVRFHSTGEMVGDTENLVINYATKRKPVLAAIDRQMAQCRNSLQRIEKEIPEQEFAKLPPAQVRLIQDLTDHLMRLERQREDIS